MYVWSENGDVCKVFGVRVTEKDDTEFYLYNEKEKKWFYENVKKFTPYYTFCFHRDILNVKDVNGEVFTVFGAREYDEETEFLLYYGRCKEWFWQKAIEYKPCIIN